MAHKHEPLLTAKNTPLHLRERGPVGSNNLKHHFASDNDLRNIMVFVIELMKKVMPEFHAMNQRSTRSILKYHFREMIEIVNRVKTVTPNKDWNGR